MGLETRNDLQQGAKVTGNREGSRVVNRVLAVLVLLRVSVRCPMNRGSKSARLT